MSKIKLTGSNSGYVEISSAADAGNLTLALPTSGTVLLSNTDNVFTGITTFAGLNITSDVTFNGASYNVLWDASDNQFEFGDNAKLSFGDSSDLQIYHGSDVSHIAENGTGPLRLSTDEFQVMNSAQNKTMIYAAQNLAVSLNYNGNTKIQTTNTGAVVTGICTATSFSGSGEGLTRTTQYSHRNIIINGAMLVAQRGTSSTGNIYQTVDRMACSRGGFDEAPTQEQVDVASGTTPYTLGFRKAYKITNGNQTNGLGANDILEAIRYRVEAQDMANCGWNYKDSNSFITLSFWVKSSVSFNMKGYFFHHDGTTQSYPLETGTLTANTWTKIERTIPGNSNVTFDNNTDVGLTISFGVYGSTFSSANPPVNQWVTYSSATLTNPSETTWYTTNDATLEITGLQLEVGSLATPFEHRSFAEELARCQRYYYVIGDARDSGTTFQLFNCHAYSTVQFETTVHYPVMRTTPSLVQGTGTGYMSAMNAFGTITFNSWIMYHPSPRVTLLYQNSLSSNPSTGVSYRAQLANSNAYVHLEAEL